MAPDVVVYTAPFCFYCVRAKQLLTERGISFRELDVRAVEGGRRALSAQSGRTSVPQIFVDGDFIGGYYELAQMDREGVLLDELLHREPGDKAPPSSDR
ncbi:MAG TPA: glutaredoxin domain-containing protein [Polyangiaceae bacterium]|jgi:glutaredoxin 3